MTLPWKRRYGAERAERLRSLGIYLKMRVARLVLVALCLPACHGGSRGSIGETPAPPPETPPPAVVEVSWSQDVWPIVIVRCQLCHTVGTGALQVPDMKMTDAPSLYQEWVRILAQCNTNFFRVYPGRSDLSFVVNKISQTAPLCGQRMPLEDSPLSDAEQQIFRDWIDQGAENN